MRIILKVLAALMVASGFVLAGMAGLCTAAMAVISPHSGSGPIAIALSVTLFGLALLLGGLFLWAWSERH